MFYSFEEIEELADVLEKGGKKAQVGEIRQWGKNRFQKRADGWYYLEGPNKGKKMGSVGRGRTKKPDSTPKKPQQSQVVEEKKRAPKAVATPGDKPEPKPVPAAVDPPTQDTGVKYSVSELTKDDLESKEGKKFRGFSTGLPSKVEYKSPEGTDTNLVGHVAFGKATLGAQQKLNENLKTAELILDDLNVRFKTPVDFVCQSLKATSKESASYNPMSRFDVRHRIDLRRDTGLQKSLMHEIGHAIDYSAGPKAPDGKDGDLGDAAFLSHSVLNKIESFGDLEDKLKELVASAENSPYYSESQKGKFGKYLRSKTEVFARGFEVLAYKKTRELVDAGKVGPEMLESFTPDLIKASKSQVPKIDDLNPQDYPKFSKELEQIRELKTEIKDIEEELHDLRVKRFQAVGEGRNEEASKIMDKVRTLASKHSPRRKKVNKLVRQISPKIRAEVKVDEAEKVVDQVSGLMEDILKRVEFRKSILEVDLIGTLEKLAKSDIPGWLTNLEPKNLTQNQRERLLEYINGIRPVDPGRASRLYERYFPKEGQQDTNLAGVSTPRMEKRAPEGVDPEKHERCVRDVKAQGKDVGTAHAICTSSLKKAEPKNKKLYEKVKAAAKRKFDVYPSAYANAWLVKEYKRRGGTYKSEPTQNDLEKGLDEWFDEQWVDIGRKKDDGSHPECGRSDADKGKYPKCVPRSKASKMSDKEKKSAVRRKRKAESTKDREGKKPINVKTKVEKSEDSGSNEKKPLNKPMRDSGGSKKFKVYVKDPETGNTKTVRFGDPDMEIKRDDKESRKNFRARHNCSEKKDKTKAGYWSCKMWSGKKVSNLTKALEDLVKTKTVTRQGVEYYAEGPHSGKKVGSVRGRGDAPEPEGRSNQVGSVEDKAGRIMQELDSKEGIPGKTTGSGKPLATKVESAVKMGYEPEDYEQAIDYHQNQAEKISRKIQELNLKDAQQLRSLAARHRREALKLNNRKNLISDRRSKTERDVRAKKETEENVSKAVTAMNHLDPRDIDTYKDMEERKEAAESGWLQKMYALMEGYEMGDAPRTLEMSEGRKKGELHLVQVDDGVYSGFVKDFELKDNPETGESERMEDTARCRIERMTLPELVHYLMAKEYITPEPEEEEDEAEPETPEPNGEPQPPVPEMTQTLPESTGEGQLTTKLKMLELIHALTSVN
jgi:hypothetical protein